MRLFGKLLRVRFDLVAKQLVLFLRIGTVHRDQECECARPLDVSKKTQPQPAAFVCTFDDPGNIGNYERAVV
jgi:hypothetical protein